MPVLNWNNDCISVHENIKRPNAYDYAVGLSQRFLEAAKKECLGPYFTFLLMNGSRPEAASGLNWDDLDLKGGKVVIFRVLKWNRKGGGWRLREYTKTDAGRRTGS